MQKKSFKLIVSLLAGITLGSGVSIANASKNISIQNHTYLKNMNKLLLTTGLSQSEINNTSL